VADAGTGRDNPESVKGLLGPAQQLIPLDVALILDVDVLVVRVGGARDLGDHRVIDDQFDGDEWIHLGRISPELGEGVSHGRQIDHPGDPGEILHEDPFGGEGDLDGATSPHAVAPGVATPVGHRFDVVGADGEAVLVPEQVLEDDLDRIGEPGHVVPVGQGIDPEDLIRLVAH